MNVSAGFWRETVESFVVSCLYGSQSCEGGKGFGDMLCVEGFDAALCSKCHSPTKYMNHLIIECIDCSNGLMFKIAIFIFPLLVILPIAILFLIHKRTSWFDKNIWKSESYISKENTALPSQRSSGESLRMSTLSKSKESEHSLETTANITYKNGSPNYIVQLQREALVFNILTFIKIVLSVIQISYAIPQNLRIIPPNKSANIIQFYGWISIASPMAYPLTCFVNTLTFQTIMELATLAPPIYIALFSILFAIEIEWMKLSTILSDGLLNFHKIELKYNTVFLWIMYVSLGSVCYSAIGSILCLDINPSDPYYVLKNDVSVPCSSGLYKLGVGWSAIALFTYLGLLPLFQFYWLLKHKKEIYNSVDITEYDINELKPVQIKSTNQIIPSFSTIMSITKHNKNIENINRKSKKFCMSAISKYQFIYSGYRKGIWYWECIESFKRIVYMCLLSIFVDVTFISIPHSLPLLLIFSGIFLLLTLVIRPYRNKSQNILAIIGEIQLFSLIASISSDTTNDGLVCFITLLCPISAIMIALWWLVRGRNAINKSLNLNEVENEDEVDSKDYENESIDLNDVAYEIDILDDNATSKRYLDSLYENDNNDVDDNDLSDDDHSKIEDIYKPRISKRFEYSIYDRNHRYGNMNNDSMLSTQSTIPNYYNPSLKKSTHLTAEEYNESFDDHYRNHH